MSNNKKLKIYTVIDPIVRLEFCKSLADNWLLCFGFAKQIMSYREWLIVIAFINCAWIKKKQEFYDSCNNWEFII